MTKLSEVIHLYIGQEYLGAWFNKPRKLTYSNIETVKDESIQLLLRPLVDMTKDEAIEFSCKYPFQVSRSGSFTWYPEEVVTLSQRGFDLFGLIESGQAIDKTKKE